MAEAQDSRTAWQKAKDNLAKIKNATAGAARNARDRYKSWVEALARNKPSGNVFMNDQDRLIGIIRRENIGRMVMFFYDPKYANELPYYDRFPLVIPIEMYDDGFLGINLHYLPPYQRAKLLDSMVSILGNEYMNEKRRLEMSYALLVGNMRSRLFEPCIKRYLYSKCRSRFYLVHPEHWHVAVLLPLERFEKANKTHVWAMSMTQIKR